MQDMHALATTDKLPIMFALRDTSEWHFHFSSPRAGSNYSLLAIEALQEGRTSCPAWLQLSLPCVADCAIHRSSSREQVWMVSQTVLPLVLLGLVTFSKTGQSEPLFHMAS